MRVAIIGRTTSLVATARLLIARGHQIGVIVTPYKDQEFLSLATDCGLELIVSTKLNSDSVTAQLRRAKCDVAVSVNWITLIKDEALSCFQYGILNAHGGDLPRYRGNACQNWAILRDENQIGLCIHKMAPELDAGPVYAREFFALSSHTYITDVYAWLARRIPEMFADSLDKIMTGVAPTPQVNDPRKALRCYPRRPEDSRIDWNRSAEEIHRLVRASSYPFDGAFCFLEDSRKLVIWRAEVFEPIGQHIAMPGQPCEPIEGDPIIACGSGFLRLTDVSVDKAEINRSVRSRLT